MNLEWMRQAACTGADVSIFFPGDDTTGGYRAARKYCGSCPVAIECVNYALDIGATEGMFGGYTKSERSRMSKGDGTISQPAGGHGDKRGTRAGYFRELAAGVIPCDDCRTAYNADASGKRAAKGVVVA